MVVFILVIGGAALTWFGSAQYKAEYPRLVSVARAISVLGLAVFLTWPFLVGRWMYDAECKYLAGYSITDPVDATAEGIYDRRLRQDGRGGSDNYTFFWDDVEMLADGRVAFFEVDVNTTGIGGQPVSSWYDRFFVTDAGSDACVAAHSGFAAKARTLLPPGKCLGVALGATSRKSRFVVSTSGHHGADSFSTAKTTKLVDKKSRTTLAKFRSYSHYNPLDYLFGGRQYAVCPRHAEQSFSPHRTLPAMVFLARNGQVMRLEQLQKENDKN